MKQLLIIAFMLVGAFTIQAQQYLNSTGDYKLYQDRYDRAKTTATIGAVLTGVGVGSYLLGTLYAASAPMDYYGNYSDGDVMVGFSSGAARLSVVGLDAAELVPVVGNVGISGAFGVLLAIGVHPEIPHGDVTHAGSNDADDVGVLVGRLYELGARSLPGQDDVASIDEDPA